MKRLFLFTLTLLFFCAVAEAQNYVVPVNYKLTDKSDYTKYEQDIVKTVDWLQQTPWTEEARKRREASDFLFKWIQGTPSIIMELTPMIINLTDRNNKLMAIFMGGYAKYAIQHPGYTKEEANIAALKAVIDKYRAEPTRAKDDDIEHLIKLEKEGGLDEWVRTEYEKS